MLKLKDTDFLTASARIRALERSMVTGRDLRKMLDASSMEEAYKIAADLDLGAAYSYRDYELALRDSLADAYRLVSKITDQNPVFDVLRLKYDGHNIKTIIKSKATGADPSPLLTELGTLPPEALQAEFADGFTTLEPTLAAAAAEATDRLARTGDPQAVDILIDRAVLSAMREKATQFGVRYLTDYVRAQIDISNIRALVRLKRIGKEIDTLQKILVEGGEIPLQRLYEVFPRGYDELFSLLAATPYGRYLEPALEGLRQDKPLTQFERLCDDYTLQLMQRYRLVPFGIEPLITYILAKEIEIQDIRIVLASKLAGVPTEQILERLRQTYA